ncbi:hypothetical protein [uncultured Endozoicomonas sp.]|uniref:hypothetical protein n=1 Tax=uncultured Endozoicomonas sp. TaxID=432652 RepID=UPI0026062C43|nr:hypothetical protein [uncultured Endozoicomonas sp.]
MFSSPTTHTPYSTPGNGSTERKDTSTQKTQTDSSTTSPTIGLKPPTRSVTNQTSLIASEFIRYVEATVSVKPQTGVLDSMNDIITAINKRLEFISDNIIPPKIILGKPALDEDQEKKVLKLSEADAKKKGLNIEKNKGFTQALMDCAKDIQTADSSSQGKTELQIRTEEEKANAQIRLENSRSELGKLSDAIKDEIVKLIKSSGSKSVNKNISSELIQLFNVAHISPENKEKLADSLIELINGGISDTSTELSSTKLMTTGKDEEVVTITP